MKRQNNYVSKETLKSLPYETIIEQEQPVPTITECVVWFAEYGIAIITDYNRLDHEWTAMACGRVPGEGECRNSQSYTDAMNAAIRDAAEIYKQQCSYCEYRSDNGICELYGVAEPLNGECYNW